MLEYHQKIRPCGECFPQETVSPVAQVHEGVEQKCQDIQRRKGLGEMILPMPKIVFKMIPLELLSRFACNSYFHPIDPKSVSGIPQRNIGGIAVAGYPVFFPRPLPGLMDMHFPFLFLDRQRFIQPFMDWGLQTNRKFRSSSRILSQKGWFAYRSSPHILTPKGLKAGPIRESHRPAAVRSQSCFTWPSLF